ncbi:MAG TPA: LysR family transcriptional regulator [Solirubrobacterales bacterium]|nr:LysR family transcriptional regulator [Solirubrobacterales bacterium]
MRFEQLEYVTAVARLGSFRRAAEELHLSQPALSETVRKLESELGVEILERGRAGASVSSTGRELLPYILETIEAVDRLRSAADEQHRSSRVVRLGTVTAATAPLLTPTIREFSEAHPSTQIEIVTAQQRQIHRELLNGSIDLGLVNYLEGDDMPPDLDAAELLRGRPVVCVRADSALAAQERIGPEELMRVPLIAMRSGYLMNRYLHRLLDGRSPVFSYSADGAEMGKLMVAEGLGAAVLPDYSVVGDPLEQSGAITFRAIEDDTDVMLVLHRRPAKSASGAAHELHEIFRQRAQEFMAPV